MDRLAEHYRLCGEALREADRDRWLASMFAPDAARPHLFALYAFNAEVARISEQVSQPLLGEMRLQWWVDALNAAGGGEPSANPTADALLATVETCGLPRQKLLDYLEARRFDLYDDPAPDRAFLDQYCDETCSVLFGLAARILGGAEAEDVAAAAGRAYAVTGLLRALPWHVARRQCYLPVDMLARHGLTPADLFARDGTQAVKAALAELRALARDDLVKAKHGVLSLPRPAREAFRLLALPGLYLDQMERRDYDPFSTPVNVAPWRRQWALWRYKS
ncbi:squalene/phytoene synthase family protein [Rhodoblastus acidophilus]|uniref:Squalene/phytoene synthase family protein n=1 Tax=Candidatus Rhodoblastus alkanivorans TaxID=2954117 RepID=A0ABS9Z7L1_9HYPH|nr:phytoene/squalene synthase family protein [Candidatus Rhodoblastus alkanivorans]MCI4678334.1 squalene/phytoene synthase family protein [Candidatus Rhodoblastus alkanivorans]MCI4683592.1 squalene/phytoene synthase family protein [Candidatus Rhodoblastus alkanivorans]MDI4640908.1 squalene/phytoene synthase family protein [Rhodoblastus acidophilus]